MTGWLKTQKRLLIIILILLGYLCLPVLINNYYNESLTQSPIVLLVGDFSDEGFGSLVEKGVSRAQKYEQRNQNQPYVGIHKVQVNESAWEDSFGGSNTPALDRETQLLRTNLIKEIVNNNVVAIISANTSQTATTVLQVGQSFNIPVLVTVSTSDNMLNGYQDVALRLIALDSRQADAIKQWCGSTDARIGLIYDLTRYGTGLRDALTTRVGPGRLIPFSVNTTTDVAGILIYGDRAKVQSWVIVGYRNQAVEFYSKKVALGLPGNMLFSDGAYGHWLADLKGAEGHPVFLSFPRIHRPDSEKNPGVESEEPLSGYGVLGFDAYRLVSRAIKNLVHARKPQKYMFIEGLRAATADLDSTDVSQQQYRFNDRGENENAAFYVEEVGNGKLP